MLCQKALLNTLPLGDIAGYFRGSDHVSGIVSERRDGERNVDLPPVFVPPHGFIVFKRFASPDSFEDPRLLVDEARGDQHRNRLTDGFRCGVTEHPCCAIVPTHDGALQIFADNGVVRRFHDGRQVSLHLRPACVR
jgi:hypothetical protein